MHFIRAINLPVSDTRLSSRTALQRLAVVPGSFQCIKQELGDNKLVNGYKGS